MSDDGLDAADLELPPDLAMQTLAVALEGTATGAWLWDVDEDRVHWSPNLGPLHGLGRGEAPITYADWLQSVHPEDRERIDGIVASALHDEPGYQCEFRVAGEPERWVHARGHVQRHPDGRPRAVAGLTLDVTDRRRREAERERMTEQLHSLQAVTDVALAHLELDALLAELLARVGHELDADIAKLLLYDEQRRALRVRASRGLPSDTVLGLRVPAGAGVAGRIASAGRPMVLSDTAGYDAVLEHLREPGRSLAGVPLRLEGETLGVLIVSSRVRVYRDEDLMLLELVADRAAQAIRHSELYEAARDAALSLQRSLLPSALPTVSGLDVAARYLPGQHGTEVGGDWFDLFGLPDGRVAMVVGDVVGRGLRAAARMSTVRTALKAYALESCSPADALQRLDRFVAGEDPLEFTTLLVAFLDPSTGVAVLSSAGHLPPLLVSEEGARLVDVPADPPLGVAEGPRREAALQLQVGDALVAYTDGLVEDRAVGLDAGLRRLRELGVPGDTSAELVQRLVGGLADPPAEDDVALIAVRRTGPVLDRTYPAEAASVPTARHDVTAFAAARGAGELLLRDVALAVSEACTNVVVHAYRERSGPPGPLRVTAMCDEDGLCVTVDDEGCGVRPRQDSPGVGLGLQIIAHSTHEFRVLQAPGGGARLMLRFAGDLR